MSPAQAGTGLSDCSVSVLTVCSCRSPIDSVVTKGDLVGLYNQCVTVSLGDGRVVEQNIYPGETHCQPIFIQSWKMLLNSQWNQVGKLLYYIIFYSHIIGPGGLRVPPVVTFASIAGHCQHSLSLFFLLCQLIFTHFRDTQEAAFFWALIF